VILKSGRGRWPLGQGLSERGSAYLARDSRLPCIALGLSFELSATGIRAEEKRSPTVLRSQCLGAVDIAYPTIRDPGKDVSRRYGATGTPETYFISARSRVVGHVVGVVSAGQLESRIAPRGRASRQVRSEVANAGQHVRTSARSVSRYGRRATPRWRS
jgi:hypothetical protein